MSLRRTATSLLTAVILLAGCTSETTSTETQPSKATDSSVPQVVAGQPLAPERCKANRAAGTIHYLSSFDFAAAASIVEVLVAKQKGYFEELCLDVDVIPSFSTENYPLIAANEAQFSSGGSFSEVIDFASRNEADFVALAVDGRTSIDALIVKDGASSELADLKGKTIGVKGAISTPVAAMLKQAGLTEGEDYATVLLDGFDPKVHITIPEITGFPGWKSSEPNQLRTAGIPFELYDPTEYGVPGSFGVLYTNSSFLAHFPTAAEDFMRATIRGLSDALADPAAAAAIAVEMINANGNAAHLSPESESARWKVEADLIMNAGGSNLPIAAPDPHLLQREVETYADIGLFGGIAPDISRILNDTLLRGLYDDSGKVIWPAS
jgi:NitT/TauT family transport system substrate-binding protein